MFEILEHNHKNISYFFGQNPLVNNRIDNKIFNKLHWISQRLD